MENKKSNHNTILNLENLPFLEGISDEENSANDEDDEHFLKGIDIRGDIILEFLQIMINILDPKNRILCFNYNYMQHFQYGLFLMLLLLISFFPIPLLALPARIVSTIATGAVILTGTSYGEKNILANK